jgi:hypothetical protein
MELEKSAEQVLPGSRGGRERRQGQEEKMTQTM